MRQSDRAGLARQWASALRTTAYVPTSRREIERLLRELLDRLFGSLTVEEFSPGTGREVGQQLVTCYFTGEQSLSRTVEVLAGGLAANSELQSVEGLAGKVTSLVGAVAAGYAAALRAQTLDQQEEVKQALLQACQDAERGWQVSEAKFRQLFTSSAVGIAISDLDDKLVETNQALRGIVGDLAAGHSLYELFHPDDVTPLKNAYQELVDGRSTGSRLPQRMRLIDQDGELAWAYLAVSLLRDADGAPTDQVTIVEDVTELHLLGQELRHQSLHDSLTSLPNQQFFMSTLESVLERAHPATQITVLKINLTGFAVVNDGFSREIGDRVLHSVAKRLQRVVSGDKATVARFGSDEFAVLIENSPTTPSVSALAARINSELAEPMYLDGRRLVVSARIGVAEQQGPGGQAALLLRAAEAALHHVRRSGTRLWGVFDPHRDADHRARCRLAAALPGAWGSGEISLDYQPLARLADGTIVGIQALLRWDHPHNGVLAHQECLELAVRTGLVLPLGHWTLRRACEQLASWRQRLGGVTPLLHVELTPQQSHDPDLVGIVRGALEQTGLAADRLQLGIPVSVLDAGPGRGGDNLGMLTDMGVAIALLGFSAVTDVAHLEDLPVRTVEIAPRVVQRVARRPSEGSAVARAARLLLKLVWSCGASAIVRGIDTQHEADWWRSAGADVGQGAFLALPGAPDKIIALLEGR
ncbi:MAG: EAL domain-containing protein [Pseudonocardiales bacterium]|nr:EAL domain-containing protein [Pseudonocardiales bacterium]